MEIDLHFIKEKKENKSVSLNYIPTKIQIADILTKALFKNPFEVLKAKLDLINIYNPTWGGVLNIESLSLPFTPLESYFLQLVDILPLIFFFFFLTIYYLSPIWHLLVW